MSLVLLALIGVLTGIGMLWVFRLMSNQDALARARRRVQAHLLELLLFSDEPSLIWRSQKQLLVANGRVLMLLLVPAVALTLPMLLLLAQLEAIFGRAPLRVGDAVILTVQYRTPGFSFLPRLETGPEIAVESPPVRVPAQAQVSWRIRPVRPISGKLRVYGNGDVVEKKIDAGPAWSYLADRRVSSPVDWLLRYPAEAPLPAGNAVWIEIRYPERKLRLWHLEFDWLTCFLIVSFASAFAWKGRMGIAL